MKLIFKEKCRFFDIISAKSYIKGCFVKKIVSLFIVLMSVFILTGCGSKGGLKNPNLPTTKQFNFEKIDFELSQKHFPKENKCYLPEELEKLLNDNITSSLEENNLISEDTGFNNLKIEVLYKRVFFGEDTFLKSDKLGVPFMYYNIYIYDDDNNLLRAYESDEMVYVGKISERPKILFGAYEEKELEDMSIKAFSRAIIETLLSLIK